MLLIEISTVFNNTESPGRELPSHPMQSTVGDFIQTFGCGAFRQGMVIQFAQRIRLLCNKPKGPWGWCKLWERCQMIDDIGVIELLITQLKEIAVIKVTKVIR